MTGTYPMRYASSRLACPKVLAEGLYKGLRYCITTIGTHPCAYVGLPKGHELYGKHYDKKALDSVSSVAHGGLTYSERSMPLKGLWNLGWDYAHYGDYRPGISGDGRKWTTEEILEDVHKVIDSIIGEGK